MKDLTDHQRPAVFPSASGLSGDRIFLAPLTPGHVESLWSVGADDSIWHWNPWPVTSEEEMGSYVAKALGELEAGKSMPYATTEQETGRVIGSTRFMNIDLKNRRVEIGCTWIAPQWQRTGLNREAKFLMLQHAFDDCGFDRVELKTDTMNQQSMTAIRKLGAVEEGVLRSHVLTRSGRVRDTIYFSILRSEWPEVRSRLGR